MTRPSTLALLLLITACGSPEGEPGDAQGMGGMARSRPAAGGSVDTTGLRQLAVPAEFRRGEELFRGNCAACHGEAALGTGQGPPLVDIVYEPNHHADAAFLLAATRGVRAHHWNFGDMPAVPGVAQEEVAEIVAYVRWLQREAGVY